MKAEDRKSAEMSEGCHLLEVLIGGTGRNYDLLWIRGAELKAVVGIRDSPALRRALPT